MTEPTQTPAALPAERTCANCACAARMTRKGEFLALDATDLESFVVCRRTMPQASQSTERIPRLDPAGQPMRNAQGQQVFETKIGVQIGYPASLMQATCFDGWRPLGTLPGERWQSKRTLQALVPFVMDVLLKSGVPPEQTGQIGAAMLADLVPPHA